MTTQASTNPFTPTDLDQQLAEVEDARQRQLDSLPASAVDNVTAAYRQSIERILEEVRTARRRLEAGLHGICAACSGTISRERLELRSWATTCATCARRGRP